MSILLGYGVPKYLTKQYAEYFCNGIFTHDLYLN